MKNVLAFALLLSMVIIGQAYAQSKKRITVSGLAGVAGKKPSGGVNVSIKGMNRATQTDSKGNYKLDNVPPGSTLVFSHAEGRSMEIPVENHKEIIVSLPAKNKKAEY